jgi:hypothetical protein
MSVIRIPIHYTGSAGEKQLLTLFDSGANLSCIDRDTIESLALAVPLGVKRELATTTKAHYIEVHERVHLNFYIEDTLLSDEFLLIPNLSEEVIIGAATMQKWRIKLDFETDSVHVNADAARLQL